MLRCVKSMLGLQVNSALVVAAVVQHSCLPLCCFHFGVVTFCKGAKKERFCTAQVENAITRATKEKRVAELTEALEQSTVVFGLRYRKISVRPLAGPSQPCLAQGAPVTLAMRSGLCRCARHALGTAHSASTATSARCPELYMHGAGEEL